MTNELLAIVERLQKIGDDVLFIKSQLEDQKPAKLWYSTDELALALDRKPFTVREHWCNGGRIQCEKDPDSGKWRIPAAEYQRMLAGGNLLPK